MTTLISPPEEIVERTELESSFICVNPEHRIAGDRREAMHLRDRRWLMPVAEILQHDYWIRTEPVGEPTRFRGRPASCPLGALADDHEWVEALRVQTSMPGWMVNPRRSRWE